MTLQQQKCKVRKNTFFEQFKKTESIKKIIIQKTIAFLLSSYGNFCYIMVP